MTKAIFTCRFWCGPTKFRQKSVMFISLLLVAATFKFNQTNKLNVINRNWKVINTTQLAAHPVSTLAVYPRSVFADCEYLPALPQLWPLSRPGPATCDPGSCADWDFLPAQMPGRLSSGPACWQRLTAARQRAFLPPATRPAPEADTWGYQWQVQNNIDFWLELLTFFISTVCDEPNLLQ